MNLLPAAGIPRLGSFMSGSRKLAARDLFPGLGDCLWCEGFGRGVQMNNKHQ
jgi:hypothetical protein